VENARCQVLPALADEGELALHGALAAWLAGCRPLAGNFLVGVALQMQDGEFAQVVSQGIDNVS